ncbi:MAG TPA: hypothetical protein VKA09_05570 [Nitrososphaeraceae archaeon]|nr:hypothetical protein [Nitrososphaeraceae archaeon]
MIVDASRHEVVREYGARGTPWRDLYSCARALVWDKFAQRLLAHEWVKG